MLAGRDLVRAGLFKPLCDNEPSRLFIARQPLMKSSNLCKFAAAPFWKI
jgi:hypothetical protein